MANLLRTGVLIAALTARGAILMVTLILAFVGLGSLVVAGLDELFLAAVLLLEVIVTLAAMLRILFFEPGPALAQHAEIMVRELEIIFGLDAVARKLSVASHALIFLEELGSIAALAVVLPVPRLSADALIPLTPTTAPAAAASSTGSYQRVPGGRRASAAVGPQVPRS